MTKILVSIRDADEARIALDFPIGILDLKEPAAGALGAVCMDSVSDIVSLVKARQDAPPVSATIGDLPPDPRLILERVLALDAVGIDYIKVGFFSSAYFANIPAEIKRVSLRARLIAVLFADRMQDFSGPCHLLSRAGFAGVMIDTADKTRGSVINLLDETRRQVFVDETRKHNLLCGLAGSLRRSDVKSLLPHVADYLGFRSALCETGRDQAISPTAMRELVAQFE